MACDGIPSGRKSSWKVVSAGHMTDNMLDLPKYIVEMQCNWKMNVNNVLG